MLEHHVRGYDALDEGHPRQHFAGSANERFPALVPVLKERDAWRAKLWLVSQVDLHRTTKVQTFLRFLKEDAKNW